MAKDAAYDVDLAQLLELVADVANAHDRTTRDAIGDLSAMLDARQAADDEPDTAELTDAERESLRLALEAGGGRVMVVEIPERLRTAADEVR